MIIDRNPGLREGISMIRSSASIFEGVAFVKSSYSEGNAYCVEVGRAQSLVGVRDSKDPSRHVLVFTPQEWDAFVKGVAAGEFSEEGASPR
jgi:hypothetical protein